MVTNPTQSEYISTSDFYYSGRNVPNEATYKLLSEKTGYTPEQLKQIYGTGNHTINWDRAIAESGQLRQSEQEIYETRQTYTENREARGLPSDATIIQNPTYIRRQEYAKNREARGLPSDQQGISEQVSQQDKGGLPPSFNKPDYQEDPFKKIDTIRKQYEEQDQYQREQESIQAFYNIDTIRNYYNEQDQLTKSTLDINKQIKEYNKEQEPQVLQNKLWSK